MGFYKIKDRGASLNFFFVQGFEIRSSGFRNVKPVLCTFNTEFITAVSF